jgi:hypothetical protein
VTLLLLYFILFLLCAEHTLTRVGIFITLNLLDTTSSFSLSPYLQLFTYEECIQLIVQTKCTLLVTHEF